MLVELVEHRHRRGRTAWGEGVLEAEAGRDVLVELAAAVVGQDDRVDVVLLERFLCVLCHGGLDEGSGHRGWSVPRRIECP